MSLDAASISRCASSTSASSSSPSEVEAQAATVIHVDWRPPAGDADMAALLSQLEDEA